MKWIHIFRLVARKEGAAVVGQATNGSSLLKLRRTCALGEKGRVLEIPKDHVIFESVRQFGRWELEEAKFLAAELLKISNQTHGALNRTVLLDIGANSGLVSLQAMNLSKTDNFLYLFEPIPQYAQAIKTNLSLISNVKICNFALSDRNSESWIYTEAANHGNTSIYENTVPSINRVKQSIQLTDTAEFFQSNLANFDNYIIKCDTQGMDALILSRIPESVWQRTQAAIIEVTALPQIVIEDVDALLERIATFSTVTWHANKNEKIKISEIRDFWLSKSERHKNLYLQRTK